jgi:ATP-dependent protease ClpP protease subunit
MRIANGALILLVMLGGTISMMQSHGDLAQTIGVLVGIALWGAPFYLAWRSLSPDSNVAMVRMARIANTVAIGLIVLMIALIAVVSDEAAPIASFLPILLIAIPLALNMKALAGRNAELNLTDAEQARRHAAPDIVSPISSTAVSTTPFARPLPSNYFMRHWRGELSLPVAYWINGSVLFVVLAAIITATVGVMENSNYSLQAISFISLGILLFWVTAWFWSVVGIWRSADHHVERGGISTWAFVAKFMVVVGAITMAVQFSENILPQAKEFALIAIGKDPIGEIDIKVSANGQSVIISGQLREGSAAEIQKILDATPSATSLVLTSNGGRSLEAQRLARVVRNRNLDTYVEDECASACTYVFLAGKDRAATPNAKIGFHQPSFPGLDADTQRSMTQDMLAVYRSAGLPEAFIQRVSETPNEDMWYPTRSELIAYNVVTRTSLGGEAATYAMTIHSKGEFALKIKSIPLYKAYERRFPGIVNEIVERGWAIVARGGSDADIGNAMRSVIIEAFPKLMETAEDDILTGILEMTINQMSAAQAISDEACAKLVAGKLDVYKTLPKDIVEQEQELILLALKRPRRSDLAPPDPAKVERATLAVADNMSQQHINVVADPEAYESQPDLVCKAMTEFYQNILALPHHQRSLVLRGIYQGDD